MARRYIARFCLRPSCRDDIGFFCLIPSCRDDILGCCGVAARRGGIMILQVPREALEFAGMSINFCSGKFGYSICPIFIQGHAEIFREF